MLAQAKEHTSAPGDAAFRLPAVSLPTGGGALRGIGETFAANPFTGSGAMTIPIALPQGRAGFAPSLALSYDSGNGNGPFGFGWKLSLPEISRRTDRGIPRYDDATESDTYLLAGSEDLVPVTDAAGVRLEDDTTAPGTTIHRYRPRTEGSFDRIERWTDRDTGTIHWRIITRDNVTTLYGRTAESRVADPLDPSRVFSWLPCERFDDRGNAMTFTYAAEDDADVDRALANERNRTRGATRYLARLRYGNRTSRLLQPDLSQLTWMFEVVLDYDEEYYDELPADPARALDDQHAFARASFAPGTRWRQRPDPFSSYRSGFERRTSRRCRRILSFHHFPELGAEPSLVRSIDFDYRDLDYLVPPTLDDELAHHGSTRAGSFLVRATQHAFERDASAPPVVRNGVTYHTYQRASFPPVDFEYTRPRFDDTLHELDAESAANLAGGVDGSAYQWVDLDGEGIAGVLTEQGGGWFYKPNLGGGRLGPIAPVRQRPAGVSLGSGRLLDLAGDGQLDLVSFDGPVAGFHERTTDEGWDAFTPFRTLPRIAWNDPNLRFVDLTGDGHADLLVTEHEVLTWHRSLAEEGFDAGERHPAPVDEEEGARLVFADARQSIYLADMCGDGLSALVRVRNGEVAYWPNLGYGRFGAKVTMDHAPYFDRDDQFDQRRLRLVDIDGSGTHDILYLAPDGARVWMNQAGNRWSAPRALPSFPSQHPLASVGTTDLLGTGTACLVWSSTAPADAGRSLRYLDLMGGTKPHLLVGTRNNLGVETRVTYASSTKFFLADKALGTPWATRLPFPVHVVERVDVHDRVSRNHFVTRYAYHQGHFDGVEREFRGFGMVEQWDTEEFASFEGDGGLPPANVDPASHVPPVLTRTWFHTGTHLGRAHVTDHFFGEYWREPGLGDTAARAFLLDDTVLPASLDPDEEREACRSLKGMMLRQETYAVDGTTRAANPYTVSETNFGVRLLQARGAQRHAVFLVHARESLTYAYEREPSDPRVTHNLTLAVDDVGLTRRSASIAYPRRAIDITLPAAVRDAQGEMRITFTTNDVTNGVDLPHDWRTPLVCETTTYEVTGLAPTPGAVRFDLQALDVACQGATPIDYEVAPTPGAVEKRTIERVRTLFRRDDFTSPLDFGALESRAVLFERYRLALTTELVSQLFAGRVTDAMLAGDGGYVHADGDAHWWIPSGRVFYSPGTTDAAPAELTYARAHFFLPLRHQDPFHSTGLSTEASVRYDAHDLLVVETRDALGNRVTVGERDLDPDRPLVRQGYDYRTLQPLVVMDPNRNRSEVAIDTLGLVVASARMGRPEQVAPSGDSLQGVSRNLTPATRAAHLANPGATAAALLGRASARHVHDLFAYTRTAGDERPSPAVVTTLRREMHDADLPSQAPTPLQVDVAYSDGFGREVQRKSLATRPPATPSWITSGWTIWNNKGKVVRRFEPFASASHTFESDATAGVSDTLLYDPLGRVAATLHADHTWEKTRFAPWREERWDASDTVLVSDPATDADVGALFARLPSADYLPTWHQRRIGGALGTEARASATKAEICAATPSVTHMDTLARAALTRVHLRTPVPGGGPPTDATHDTRVVHDVEGALLEVVDARDITVARYTYDIAGTRLHIRSSDAGERWTLVDVLGKPIHTFDAFGRQLQTRYDALRRPVSTTLRDGATTAVVGRLEYGEGEASAIARGLRGQVVRHFDQAGVVTTDSFDFKGNALRHERRLATEHKAMLDWGGAPSLEATTFPSSTTYDALDRPISLTAPDASTIFPAYDARGKLAAVDVRIRGDATITPFVTAVEHNARGQRTRITLATRDGAGITTRHEYDPESFRIARITTRRDAAAFDGSDRPGEVQDLRYTYDAIGNVTHARDAAQQTVFFRNRRVEPDADYVYDALHRLVEASGREQLGQNGAPAQSGPFDAVPTAHPGDGNALGTYVERYSYDAVGNLLAMRHLGSDPANPGWKRCYQYAIDSNRLMSTGAPNAAADPDSSCAGPYSTTPLHADRYTHDAHGNMTAMPHLPVMRWDHRDQLQSTATQVANGGATPETTWYAYDAVGERVRKVVEHAAPAGQPPRRKCERIYLRGFEVYREYGADGTTVTLERQTLHILAGAERLAMVETRTDVANPAPLVRYQFGTLVGSASLELDRDADLISYEEYYPYGASAYRAARNATEAEKRYRYTARERDEETGLSYHGVRYYAPWLGRWTAADPIGVGDGANVYLYVSANPIRMHDPSGTDGEDETKKEPKGTQTVGNAANGAPTYSSTGDKATADAGKVGELLWEKAKGSDEAKAFKRLVLDPELAKLKTGFEKDWKESKAGVIAGGSLVLVPSLALLTYLTVNDRTLDIPILGEKSSRELAFKGWSGLVGLGSDALFGDKASIGISHEKKDGKDRYGYQQTMPFLTDSLKLDFDARWGDKYSKMSLGLKYAPDKSHSFSLSGSSTWDDTTTTYGGSLKLKFPIYGAPFSFGAKGSYKLAPDTLTGTTTGTFTGGAEGLYEPNILGSKWQFGFQGFIGATPPKGGPFMSKTDLGIVPQWPLPMYTPSGTGFFLSLTIPTDSPKKK